MLLAGAAGIAAGAATWLLVSLLLGDDLAENLIPALAGVAVAALVVLLTAGRGVSEAIERAEAGAERVKREAERVTREAEERLAVERRRGAALDRARRAERAWASELRSQIMHLHRSRGPLGHTDDTRELVLKVALSALDAKKGLLLERPDGDDGARRDGDGLRAACSDGFENDPSDSALAQHVRASA